MIYSLRKQCIDIIFMIMLILSTGGLLFVFNRNIASVLFLLFSLFVLIFMEDKWKKTIVNSILFTFSILVVLGIINYFFSEFESSLELSSVGELFDWSIAHVQAQGIQLVSVESEKVR